jgi:TolB protein
MNRVVWIAGVAAAFLMIVAAQQPTIGIGTISKDVQNRVIAIPDLRGTGDAQKFMGAFNDTLRSDVAASGMVKVAPKTMYPLFIPQQPSDIVVPPPPPAQPPRGRKSEAIPQPASGGGRWMADWSGPPVMANYLAFGYTAPQNGVLVLYGCLYDLSQGPAPSSNAQVIGQRYLGSLDEAGARKVAHEFAADIIARLGGESLFGTHIYFTSDRTGHKEIWMMDPDGKNQKQLTHFNSISIEGSPSPDGAKIAFTSFVRGNPGIFVFSVDPVRDLRFYNQGVSVNSSPSFTPDGKQIVYSSSAGRCCRIFIANLVPKPVMRSCSHRAVPVRSRSIA